MELLICFGGADDLKHPETLGVGTLATCVYL